jgi:hypothetical protein
MNLYSSLLLLGALNAAVAARNPCAIKQDDGSMKTYLDGESTDYFGTLCIDSTSFEAVDFLCQNGDVVDTDTILTCPSAKPNCVQCGAKSMGAALCQDTTEVPAYCDNLDLDPAHQVIDVIDTFDRAVVVNITGVIPLVQVAVDPAPPSALPNVYVGDIGVTVLDDVGIDPQANPVIVADVPRKKKGNGGAPCKEGENTYPDGASTKSFGLECLNATHYDAVAFVCVDGAVNDTDVVMACPVFDAPYCVQCGARSFGSALCLATPDVPDYCDTFTVDVKSAVVVKPAGNSTGTGKMMMMMMKKGLGATAALTNTTRVRALQEAAAAAWTPQRRFRGSTR